jgi:hypothetical protein
MARKKTINRRGLSLFQWSISTVLLPAVAIFLAWVAFQLILTSPTDIRMMYKRPDTALIGFIAITTTLLEFQDKVPQKPAKFAPRALLGLTVFLVLLSLLIYIASLVAEKNGNDLVMLYSVSTTLGVIIVSTLIRIAMFE